MASWGSSGRPNPTRASYALPGAGRLDRGGLLYAEISRHILHGHQLRQLGCHAALCAADFALARITCCQSGATNESGRLISRPMGDGGEARASDNRMAMSGNPF